MKPSEQIARLTRELQLARQDLEEARKERDTLRTEAKRLREALEIIHTRLHIEVNGRSDTPWTAALRLVRQALSKARADTEEGPPRPETTREWALRTKDGDDET